MKQIEVIELKKSILENNEADAENLREELKKQGTLYVNLMSSPGSGKTTTLLGTIRELREIAPVIRIGIMEADIDSDVDAHTIAEQGNVPVVQLHTGGMCHLDAQMSRQGLEALEAEAAGVQNDEEAGTIEGPDTLKNRNPLDLAILENVGNLVCPAEFDTGAHLNVAILSITEGHDKPLKYPLMFEICDAVLINKIDAAELFDFDFEKASEYIRKRNPQAQIFPISARTGEGMAAWAAWLENRMTEQGDHC